MIFEKKLNDVLQEIVTRWGIPGLSVGIVDGGEIAYTRSFGVQNLETQIPVTPESILCLQSIAKCFDSSAVMKLDVLNLNIHAVPESVDSYTYSANLHLQKRSTFPG